MIAIVLAGGSGTRFWPLSRHAHPKQSLVLWGDQPMIAHTVSRLSPSIPPERVLVVCGPHLVEQLRAALPHLPADQFIVEPTPRNTAPAIALATAIAQARFGDDVIGVFPSDHYIGDLPAFHQCLAAADAEARAGSIVTMGIPPTRPETGFGYIRYEPPADRSQRQGKPWPVASFVEKPDHARALQYLDSGDYLWNAGMFFFTAATMMAELARSLPDMLAGVNRIARGDAELAEVFPTLQNISIDYGVMERAQRVSVIPATFTWSDVGHWAALHEVQTPDAQGNVTRGHAIAADSRHNVIWGTSDRLVALIGVDDLVVVDTPDAVLVLPRARAQDVRLVIDQLKATGRTDLL